LGLVVQTTFSAWQNQWFTPTEISQPAVSGDGVMLAKDGITNLMKYALNLSPKAAGLNGLPVMSVTSINGLNYLSISYTKVLGATDILYVPEVSGDLKIWYSGTNDTVTASVTNNPDLKTQTIVVRDATPVANASARFIRLRINKP
jgi:hypothetical protein